MKRFVLLVMRLIAGVGGFIFLSFAITASLLMFFHYHQGMLALDPHGPYWRYGRVALGCWFSSGLWWLLWRLLPAGKSEDQTVKSRSAFEERPISIGFLQTTTL